MEGLPEPISTRLPMSGIAAPMLRVPGVELVSAACSAGSSVRFRSPLRVRSSNSMTDGDLVVLIEDGRIIAMLQPRSLGTCLRWSADDSWAVADALAAARRPVSRTEPEALLPALLPLVLG